MRTYEMRTEMPFANDTGRISSLFQQLRKRDFLGSSLWNIGFPLRMG